MRRITLFLISIFFSCLAIGQTGKFFPSERFSSGLINDICQDRYGYVWIATENGLNKFDGYRFTTYYHQPGDSTALGSNIVVKVFCDSKGQLWAGTRTGISRYDYATDRFVNYRFEGDETPRVTSILERRNGEFLVGTSGRGVYHLVDGWMQKVPGGYTTSGGNWYFNQMLEDSRERFWKVGYGEELTMMDKSGVHRYRVEQGIVVKLAEVGDDILVIAMHGISVCRDGVISKSDIDLSAMGGGEAVISSAYQDSRGNIYIGTRGDGLFVLAKGSRKLERVEAIMRDIDLNTAKILAIGEDRQGNIWLGCQSKGLVVLPRHQPQFASWSFSAQHYFISSTITSVCRGDRDITWCTVQGSGVFGFDNTGHIVAHPSAPSAAELIYRDRRGNYWLGTGEALYAYNPLTGRSQQQARFVCDKLNCIVDDGQGNLYISTYSRGFWIYNTDTHAMRQFQSTDANGYKGRLCNNWVMAMLYDSAGRVWLATSSGVSCYNPRTDSFRDLGWESLMQGMICFSLCETRGGTILIGTDQGIYSYKAGDQEAVLFSEDGGLADKSVGYIVEAANGDIWCSTSMGIWQFDASKKKFIGHVNGNGLTAKEYVNGAGMHSEGDVICFVNNDGLTVFRPSEVKGSHEELPDVCLTGFLIAGNPVNTLTESGGSTVAEGPVIETDHYSVSYLDNNVQLEFSLLDFNTPENIIFEYRINGSDWHRNPEGQNVVQLTHLMPGTYEIEVRALSAGIYSPSKTISVKVTPPWYRSTFAYLLYALLLLGLLGLIAWFWRRQTAQQLSEDKMKFLINATHDIRSPLTLIMGAVGKLKDLRVEKENEPEIVSDLKSQISVPVDAIDRNAQRLMLLVNQILDERRIDKDQLQLHCRETNMVSFIGGICKLYQFNANQRNITFTFEHDKDHTMAWVDRINFDKVVSNLLSNAFKYTYDGGEVKVVLSEHEKDVEIQVIDNGVGFKGEDTDRLFDRFYQGRNTDDLGLQGTGIGLNLSRAITLLHGGKIKAANRTDGNHGACFTVTLPKGNVHLKADQIVTDSPAREVLSKGSDGKSTYRQFHILIVDDDLEIANYIIDELGDRYKFAHVPNGKEGLKTLLTEQYDLVISDVMMPEMDGLTMLKRIKENPAISQLPVIMLTSKAAVEHKLEGLKSGADAYIAKPFNMEELHIQIDNLIDNVRRLKGKFSGAVSQEQRVENIEVKGNDDALMERIMRSVNANLSKPDFNVDALADDVGISRAQLHRKMKEITGIPSGRFLRNLRMEQAARLLSEGKVNISQVADCVGYADQAHFSTAFKAHFGVTPTEYVEKNKKN